jgi:hypothetical protein
MTELSHMDRYADGEELVFQMSSEAHRQQAIDAFKTAYGECRSPFQCSAARPPSCCYWSSSLRTPNMWR